VSRILTLEEAKSLPRWRRPETLLVTMAVGMPLAFATWGALLNNFVIEAAQFDGSDIGWLQTVREIPGFLSFLVIFLLRYIREQALALTALLLLGAATIATSHFPSFWGLLATTMLSSIGFHYYETVNQSLQLQWLEKGRAPKVMGWLVAAGSAGSLVAYGAIVMTWRTFNLSYDVVYLASGGATMLIALYCWLVFPYFAEPVVQHRTMVLRPRYWLYYALVFMAGARRQIFVVFAGFMMVEKFGFDVHELTALFLINYLANMLFAPMVGRAIGGFGERVVLIVEYIGLIGVFALYSGIYAFDWPAWLAAALYVVDHLFFAMAFAQKTYFQKIGDPADIAPTAAVAFTINHIAAVFLPAALGYVWMVSPGIVFGMACAMACCSLALATLVPRHPAPGCETAFAARRAASAPAE